MNAIGEFLVYLAPLSPTGFDLADEIVQFLRQSRQLRPFRELRRRIVSGSKVFI
jgi:hypothetical protein